MINRTTRNFNSQVDAQIVSSSIDYVIKVFHKNGKLKHTYIYGAGADIFSIFDEMQRIEPNKNKTITIRTS